ncbi:MAG: EamA family transporter RarD [Actinobacteria bacterium]|jgi:chloramphenicol-sensitive protein RarD|nr:EamA family transporter RarD [Actinomycetota bacterium]MDP7551537.1 EamA family transporter RarD [Acidimicrobiales bacterium]MBT3687125.1 EamA family transporter RarD [Actinomycetota bacterium]MBT4037554.1 EamA family transporter RarD [Actinomycetota bacterium]MBT4279854.1 EamA family transporter RarD [Actinomycetota bacterium]|tara:strand:+ start:1248 stop:2138 length:891 start_codon:yes stop_codon:yes gene_type:complete
MQRGLVYAICAYTIWGLSPVFWKSLSSVPAADVLGHRALWIFVFVMVVHLARRSWRDVIAAASSPRILVLEIVAAALLGTNWLTWVWAMNTDRVLEGSLGYFINPLVSVFLGVVFLGESLRRGQWVAISLATIGVVWLTVGVGSLPWVSLVLGFTFGFYGLLKKKIDSPPLVSLAIEVSVMIIPALVFLSLRTSDGAGVVGPSSPGTTALLVASGAFTGVPLLLFAGAARRIPLSLIGMLQYLAPTLNFVLGVFVYGEFLDGGRLVGFAFIWTAVAVFATDGWRSTHNLPFGELRS